MQADGTQHLPVLRVGGVPEHFNWPWHMAIANGCFTRRGLRVEWVEQGQGTGAMVAAANAGHVDVIVALTEGLIAEIAKGSDLRLLGTYVQSPLCWAISAGRDSSFHSVEDLKGQKFGISRYGSGSHLMAYVLALERAWHSKTDIAFEVKGDFKSLRDSLNDGSTAAFLWETFTTKPFHDSGEIRRIGEITSPWPCFMMAARSGVIEKNKEALQAMLAGIRESCLSFHNDKTMPETIAAQYGLTLHDATQWYDNVQIIGTSYVSEGALDKAVRVLYQAKVLSTADYKPEMFIHPDIASLRKDIKLVRLYNKPELLRALYGNLKAAHLTSGPISYQELLPFDQHHYHEVEGLEVCIKEAKITAKSSVINVGSGLGGPARFLSGKLGAQILALELQDDLHRAASELTYRCGLSHSVHHMAGDIMQVGHHLRPSAYDAVVSWLTILHIPDRENLFKILFSLMKPGAVFYAEDFFELHPLTNVEMQTLNDEVFCPYLPDAATYQNHLTTAGFTIVKFEDLTDDWKQYTAERVQRWDANRDTLVNIHGEDTYKRLRYFYNTVKELYQGGNLGGARIVAIRPALLPPSHPEAN